VPETATLPWLIDRLSDPNAYAHPTEGIEVRQTHISVVALAGPYVYKVRKPVELGFLDFSTLEKRRSDCFEEVRLNRRTAPDVYLGVVPIVRSGTGIRVDGEGAPIEWAVKMHRLPDDASLLARLERGKLDGWLIKVAERVAAFHRTAERSPGATAAGHFDNVAKNARENFDQIAADVGTTVSASVFGRLRKLTEEALARLRPLIEQRAERGISCDGHGDLRLEHVYAFPDRAPPGDLAIIDCVEFSERIRCGDPVGDAAFLAMELAFRGRPDIAQLFADAYLRFAHDEEGRDLLPFYMAYRSIVRAKVRGFELHEPELDPLRRTSSLAKAKKHFLLALDLLEPPPRRPALVMMGGLPGTGKSTLALALAQRAGFEVIRSDVVRKELAGVGLDHRAASAWQTGLYSPEWTARTYAECRRRAEDALFEGRRVIVDATFASEEQRLSFIEAGRAWCAPVVWLVCLATRERTSARLAARQGDPSDADEVVYERARSGWEPPGRESAECLAEIDTDPGVDVAIEQAVAVLERRHLYERTAAAHAP